MTDNKLMVLPDVQSSADRRNIPIRRVGVKGIRTPILVKSQSGAQHTVADVEIMLAADELHTFDHWKKEGKSVKKGEKHLVCCYLWKYTTKPSKEQREKAAAEGKEAAPDPHYYPTKSHLFSCLQVESSKPAPAGRFGSTAAIIEYNKKLAAERKAAKAAKEAAEKAKAEAPAPVIIEEHHELPELVHVDPLPTKKAAAKKKPAGPNMNCLLYTSPSPRD